MLTRLLSLLLVIVIVLAGIVSMQPSEFNITRSATMNTTADVVFAQVNDFHHWEAWSPWAKLDPNAKNSFEGPEAGKGAIMRWAGNHEVGEGSATITESQPNTLVRMRLDFIKPFAASNIAEFTFKPEGEHTIVTWSMHGTNNFISKAIGLIMNCEKMVGEQFEKGLANMKTLVEKQSVQP